MPLTLLLPEEPDSASSSPQDTPPNPCLEQQNALEAAAAEVDRAIAVLRERAVAMMQCQQRQSAQESAAYFETQTLVILTQVTNITKSVKALTSCPACKQPETPKAE